MKPTSIMIHHSAVSHERNADQFKANNEYHRAKWNFKSSLGFFLGYNYEIAANGKLRQARTDGEQTAACYQKNMNSGQWQRKFYKGNYSSVEFNKFPQYAEGVKALYGIGAGRVQTPGELASGIDAMLKHDGPYLLEVMIPKEEDVLPMIPGGKTINEMILAPGQTRQD
jgi:hypothetical protein